VPFHALKRKATISSSSSFRAKKENDAVTKDIQGLPQTGELSNIGTRAMVLLLSNRFENFPIKNFVALPCESTLENTLEM